jgi:hypothetical protein
VTTFRIGLPAARYPTGGDREAFHQRLADSLAAIPGVANVGTVSRLPANGAFHTWSFRIDGRAEVRPGEPFGLTDVRCVGGQYFQALGIALLSGWSGPPFRPPRWPPTSPRGGRRESIRSRRCEPSSAGRPRFDSSGSFVALRTAN